MAGTLESLDRVLQQRGVQRSFDAFVVGCGFAGSVAAFALGDGTLHLATQDAAEWRVVPAHDGAVLALASAGDGFLTGGDDGRLIRTGPDGKVTPLAGYGSRWVEQVAWFADARAAIAACAVGKTVHLLDAAGTPIKSLAHPSTVTGIAFDARGKRIAASHYNGVSLWFVASKSDKPRSLEWKGSHLGVAISPDGDNVVSSMQENALHGWRLSDGQHMRMSGYPSKPRAMSFSRNGRWLASSGAEAIVLWPFTGGGPMGKPPTELAGRDNVVCTRVVCHPQEDMVAAGFSDGMVVCADIAGKRILPICGPGSGAGRGSISALAWNDTGSHLAFGTETGTAALVDLSQR